MIILLDNYDSFTWNLWHFLNELGAIVKVVKNDQLSPKQIIDLNPKGLVISPGPGVPENAGITLKLIDRSQNKFPILGVCLGHQSICVAFGGKLIRLSPPIHGKISTITHKNEGIFDLIPSMSFQVTRYHSLAIDPDDLPNDLKITAISDDNVIMGLMHNELQIHGVQFHPESVLSMYGYRILSSFLRKCGYDIKNINEFINLENKLIGSIQ